MPVVLSVPGTRVRCGGGDKGLIPRRSQAQANAAHLLGKELCWVPQSSSEASCSPEMLLVLVSSVWREFSLVKTDSRDFLALR